MFVIFGGLNGVGIAANHYWKKRKIKMPKVLAWFITFNFVNLTFIFFRAKEMDDAFKVLSGMVGASGVVLQEKYLQQFSFLNNIGIETGKVTQHIGGGSKILTYLIIAFLIVLLAKNVTELFKNREKNYTYKDSIIFGIMFFAGVVAMSITSYSEFLYFNF